ncbi:class I SAM-dependent methyltransferase [Ruminococcus flavefaciens]|uniref:Methyltransferase domain-containing protein n=1 Tax=Ruminococcus flavefaciens TaxID=1265 RepID=A0A1M7H556_RUMFL|nr:class I SAM-dependent methyltransferase [Ruminococcus flavefaciens]SHM23715.1 Methyltransferase domain-containing protein [Ruminococcus flavefaciens]
MDIQKNDIDGGKSFDWGRTSSDYAKFRDIYPPVFFGKVAERGLCVKGQRVLDIGTGTGVVPRNMYKYGASWTGADISENQIEQAKILAQNSGMNIDFVVSATEELDFPDETFDVITACQCFFYFDYDTVIPKLAKLLKKGGRLVILFMAWLPDEDKIAWDSESLVLKYNPKWTGGRYVRKPVFIPENANDFFTIEYAEDYDLMVPFTRESWNGRMKACRGIGASLRAEEISAWEREHMEMLAKTPSNEFDILHHAAMAILKKK